MVQLYLGHPAVAGAPKRALQGSTRIHLQPGEKKTVQFGLRGRDLGIVEEAGKHRIAAGAVRVWLGGGPPGMGAERPGVEAGFKILDSELLPD